MVIKDTLIPEYDHGMVTTRRLLDRAPESEFGWKPHEKSMALGRCADISRTFRRGRSAVLDGPMFDLATAPDMRSKMRDSHAALMKEFDTKVAAARASLGQRTDAEMLSPWTLKDGTHEIFTRPKISAIRSFVTNHSIHHRGQLSVYLRRNVPIPPIYGPTADEQ